MPEQGFADLVAAGITKGFDAIGPALKRSEEMQILQEDREFNRRMELDDLNRKRRAESRELAIHDQTTRKNNIMIESQEKLLADLDTDIERENAMKDFELEAARQGAVITKSQVADMVERGKAKTDLIEKFRAMAKGDKMLEIRVNQLEAMPVTDMSLRELNGAFNKARHVSESKAMLEGFTKKELTFFSAVGFKSLQNMVDSGIPITPQDFWNARDTRLEAINKMFDAATLETFLQGIPLDPQTGQPNSLQSMASLSALADVMTASMNELKQGGADADDTTLGFGNISREGKFTQAGGANDQLEDAGNPMASALQIKEGSQSSMQDVMRRVAKGEASASTTLAIHDTAKDYDGTKDEEAVGWIMSAMSEESPGSQEAVFRVTMYQADPGANPIALDGISGAAYLMSDIADGKTFTEKARNIAAQNVFKDEPAIRKAVALADAFKKRTSLKKDEIEAILQNISRSAFDEQVTDEDFDTLLKFVQGARKQKGGIIGDALGGEKFLRDTIFGVPEPEFLRAIHRTGGVLELLHRDQGK